MNTREPTAEPYADRLASYVFTQLDAWAPPDVVEEMLQALGLDPSMSVARLRADLAIAQRARAEAAKVPIGVGSPITRGWRGALAFILGDDA